MTDEQRERLRRRIVDLLNSEVQWEFYNLRIGKAQCHDFANALLSLLDSHAVDCNAADWAIERVQSEYVRGRVEGTARCVEKVRSKADSYQKDSERPDFLPNYKKQMAFAASALREAATELESLLLEQSEQLDGDLCPRCGGSFTASGGRPVKAPMICQKCASEDWVEQEKR